jgi:hypothetical protein
MTDSTATQGNILKGGAPFVHNFGVDNTFIGKNAGNLSMNGQENTACGAFALGSNTTGYNNTASGVNALQGICTELTRFGRELRVRGVGGEGEAAEKARWLGRGHMP